jgi:hypothetical protein
LPTTDIKRPHTTTKLNVIALIVFFMTFLIPRRFLLFGQYMENLARISLRY